MHVGLHNLKTTNCFWNICVYKFRFLWEIRYFVLNIKINAGYFSVAKVYLY